MFDTISIIGCGLIGSSILRAIKNKNIAKEIKIFDINSKQILKKTINSNELSIEKLKPGFYFMEINGQYKKLIKE